MRFLVSISDLGNYIGSGSQGSVWQHATEPDKIIKVMKGFPVLKDGEMDAFQYDRYLERRIGATKWMSEQEKWMFPPMANKMVLYLFNETMAMRKDNLVLPTGQVKVYAVDTQIFELKDMRRLYKTIVNNGQFGEASEEAKQFKRDWLTILSPGHRHGYLMVQEKLERIGGRSRAVGQERPKVFEQWSTFLWDDFGLVTRDTKNPGNYGFRNNKELVIYDPVVAPLPEQNDWSSRNVFNRLRYAYFVYLFTDIPKINDIDEHDAYEVNKIIRRFEKQIIAGNFYRIERSAEGFPGSYQPEPSLNDYGLRDIMYSGTASDNFQQTLTNFSSEVPEFEEIEWEKKKPAPDWQDDIEWDAEELFNAAPKQTKVKFPRAKADKIVATVKSQIKPYVEKMMACGSYRRGAQMIGDIDFVVILKDGYTLPQILPSNQGINWVGEQKAQIIIEGEKVDFRVTTPEAWGATILYFTGPADFNIKYRWMAKRRGLKLSEYGLFNRESDEYLAGATEEDVFTALGRPYKDPAQRQGFSKSKKKTTKKAETELLLHPLGGWNHQIDLLEEFPNAKNFGALLNQEIESEIIVLNSLEELLAQDFSSLGRGSSPLYYVNFPLTVFRGVKTKDDDQWTWQRWLEDDKMGTSTNMTVEDSQPSTLNIQEALNYAGAQDWVSKSIQPDFELYSIDIQDYFVMLPRQSERYYHHRSCNPVSASGNIGVHVDGQWQDPVVSCDNPNHMVAESPVIFILGGAQYEDLNVVWDSDANYASFDAESKEDWANKYGREIKIGKPGEVAWRSINPNYYAVGLELGYISEDRVMGEGHYAIMGPTPANFQLDWRGYPMFEIDMDGLKYVISRNTQYDSLLSNGTNIAIIQDIPITKITPYDSDLGIGRVSSGEAELKDGSKVPVGYEWIPNIHSITPPKVERGELSWRERFEAESKEDWANKYGMEIKIGKQGEIAWRAMNPNDYTVGLESGHITSKHEIYAMLGKTPTAFQLAWRGYPLFEIDMEGLKYIKAPNTQWNQPRHTNIVIVQDIPVDKVVPYDSDLGIGKVSPYRAGRGRQRRELPHVVGRETSFQDWTSRFGGVPWPGYGGSYEAEEDRCCKECDKTTGLTTIQAGTYCYDCLPINLGAEDNYDATYGVKQAKIRRKLKNSIKKQNTHGTKAGQWSARKSQLLKQKYEAACERKGLRAYKGKKTQSQDNLSKWSQQKWGTGSGKKSSTTGEAYFPAKAVEALKKRGLYAKATRQKRAATKAGKQRATYSKDIQNIVADYRAEDQPPICPICDGYIPNDERPGAYPGAISRYDNHTEVCSACGTTEGVGMMILGNEINVLADEAKEFTDDPWEIWRYIIANAKEQLPPMFFGRTP